MHWRRKWQPTPVFLPGESQERGSLVGCRLWGHTEADTTEVTQQQQQQQQCYFPGSLGSWSQHSYSKGSGLDLQRIFFSLLQHDCKSQLRFSSASSSFCDPSGRSNTFATLACAKLRLQPRWWDFSFSLLSSFPFPQTWLLVKMLMRRQALCPSQTWRPGHWYPTAGDMKAKEAGSLPCVELAFCNVATAGMLATPEAEGTAEHMTQWQKALCSRCQSPRAPKTPTRCCK